MQGLTLPAVLRLARLPADTTPDEEEHLARRHAAEAGLAALDDHAAHLNLPQRVRDQVRHEYDEQLRQLERRSPEPATSAGPEDPPTDATAPAEVRDESDDLRRLLAALITTKRAAVVDLRDHGTIDDLVLTRVQAHLDAEELRLTGGSETE